jgi:hypothetical protein
MEGHISADFSYYGQDFNPDWEACFGNGDGQFYLLALPQVPDIECELVACTQTLHFLAQHPIAVYATVLSFNTLLVTNGLCYITVPEKETQPGMLDLLERAAVDGNFEILDAGRCRLIHRLGVDPSQNITTFLYLSLRKKHNVDNDMWRLLVGASFWRYGYKDGADLYGVSGEADIPDHIRLLEMDLDELLGEPDRYMRTFRYALGVAFARQASAGVNRPRAEYEDEIRRSIAAIHRLLVDSSPEQRMELSQEAARYLVCLAGWYVCRYAGRSMVEIVHNVRPVVARVLEGQGEDIRVHLHELSSEQIARLIKHLFEMCQFLGIDLRKAIDSLV